jgi:transketolase
LAAKTQLDLSLPLETCDIDLRDAFFDDLNKIADGDPNVLLLTDDQDAFSLGWMRQNLPNQYLNAGISEQNLISVASGLALGGKTPFVYGIAAFMTMRCYEQIRDDLCALNLPVTIVASGGGFGYSGDGPTHHATQDVAIMRTLPNMTIFNPSDATSTSHFAHLAYKEPGPKYVRIERGTIGRIYSYGHYFGPGLDVLSPGTDLMIISTGMMVHNALKVAEDLARQNIKAGVIDVYRLKPVDPETLISAIGDVPRVVTLEEHSIIGGLGSLVSEILSDQGTPKVTKRFGIPDRFVYRYGSREWMQSQVGLDDESIVKGILKWVRQT